MRRCPLGDNRARRARMTRMRRTRNMAVSNWHCWLGLAEGESGLLNTGRSFPEVRAAKRVVPVHGGGFGLAGFGQETLILIDLCLFCLGEW